MQEVEETQVEYKARILSYQEGEDPLRLQIAAPIRVRSLVRTCSSEDLRRRPAPEKWCINEIAAHLADDELVGAYRIRLILSACGTSIQAFDQDVWSRMGRYSEIRIDASLDVFQTLRRANLRLLRSLSDEEWQMYGVHAERGRESIHDIAMYYAGHDINHFRQIEAILEGTDM